MNIGKQIKSLRLKKNVKQDELADYLGVSYQAV
ncbi:helix-turn-helix domain-containing protein [Clostridium culturomicium]|nr:helix-turn-helix transcriptional regulator [Clostridium culturomicium]